MSTKKKGPVHGTNHSHEPGDGHNSDNHQNPHNTEKPILNSKNIWRTSKLSSSEIARHSPENVSKYFGKEKQIQELFESATNETRSWRLKHLSGDIGEAVTEQSIYAIRGNEPVTIHPTKMGRKGIDVAATKGKTLTFVIDAKGTVNPTKIFELEPTKTQGKQLSSEWMEAKHTEMNPPSRSATAQTVETSKLLKERPYTKHIAGIDIDYPNQQYRLVTNTGRYETNLPEDVTIWNPANQATKAEMKAMKGLNVGGKALAGAAYMLDAAEIIGQVRRDFRTGNYGATFRLMLEKGGAYTIAAATTVTVTVETAGLGLLISTSTAIAGYTAGEYVGKGFSNAVGLRNVSDEERHAALKEGMELLGPPGTAIVDGMDYVSNSISDTISVGVSTVCEATNNSLPFNICTPNTAEPASTQQTQKPEQKQPEQKSDQPDISHSESKTVNSDSQLQSLSENISAKSEEILARRLEILQSHAENFSKNDQENLASMSSAEMQTNQSTDKPLGFHARRLAIMHASAENKNVSENSQPALQQSLAENHSDNQSRLNTSESEACYESPRPTPYC